MIGIRRSRQPLAVVTFALSVAIILPLTAFVCLAQGTTESASLAAWSEIATVLRNPRCLNCHQIDSPLQGDSRRIHFPAVVRGPTSVGAGTMRCYSCHNDRNNEMARVPGAPGWSLAPANMVWEGKSDVELCELLRTPGLYHGHFPGALVQHMTGEPLVTWAWDPGPGRAPIPLSHDDFVGLVKVWIAGGLSCPKP